MPSFQKQCTFTSREHYVNCWICIPCAAAEAKQLKRARDAQCARSPNRSTLHCPCGKEDTDFPFITSICGWCQGEVGYGQRNQTFNLANGNPAQLVGLQQGDEYYEDIWEDYGAHAALVRLEDVSRERILGWKAKTMGEPVEWNPCVKGYMPMMDEATLYARLQAFLVPVSPDLQQDSNTARNTASVAEAE